MLGAEKVILVKFFTSFWQKDASANALITITSVVFNNMDYLSTVKAILKEASIVRRVVRNRGGKRLDSLYVRVSDLYNTIIEQKGLSCSEEIIRKQVLSRRSLQGKPKKAWGRLHTFFIDDNGDYSQIHMHPALQRAGRCTVVDWKSIAGSPRLGNPMWNGDNEEIIKGLMRQLENADKSQSVDLIFCACTVGTLGNKTVEGLATLNIPLVSYWADDKQNFWEHMGGVPGDCPQVHFFDLCWTTSDACIPWYIAEGGRAIAMPEGADPGTFYRKMEGNFRFDVSFVGAKYGIRPEIIDYLKGRGISVKSFGYGWDNSPLGWQDMASVFAESRINLGFAWVGHSLSITTLKGRDFEVPMAGGLYLTGFSEELSRHYQINHEIVCYNSILECVDVIRYLLAKPDVCDQIRKNGQKRALNEHTWDARYEKLVAFMGITESMGPTIP